MSGKVKAGFNNLARLVPKPGQSRILAIADLKRHPYLPDVKTFKEAGLDVDDSSVNFRGVALPKGTPRRSSISVRQIFPKMFNDPGILAKMKEREARYGSCQGKRSSRCSKTAGKSL